MPEFQVDYDVVIVGFGPAGVLAANFLGKQGHRVLVLEKDMTIYPLPRAIHFDAEIMRVYQAAGLADKIAPTVVSANECEFVTDKRKRLFCVVNGHIPEPYGWPERILFRQPELEALLREGLTHYPNVTVKLGWNVTAYSQDENWITLVAEGTDGQSRQVRARYALGCDGGSSTMRRLSGIEYVKMAEFKQPWLVVDTFIDVEDDTLPKIMMQLCDSARPTTYIPRVGTKERRWEFFILEGETPEEMQKPERIRELLRRWIDPQRVTIERTAIYTFRALIAEHWRDGRMFLVGDAAHLMPPFAGQGLCSGARDAHNITWKLDLVLRHKADPVLLDTYEQERSPHIKAVTQLAVNLGRFIMVRQPIVKALRDAILPTLGHTPLLSREVLLPGLTKGLLLRGTPAAGTRFIQPHVTMENGGVSVRLDEALGDEFAILAMNVDPRTQLEPGAAALWQNLGTRFIQVLPANQPFPGNVADGLNFIRDDNGELSGWFARQRRTTVIIRPDRYVFGTFNTDTQATRTLREALRLS
ncbi:MAG: bifunctional 3-(3-hydroxy-phenyl)propionate/3-hydroxycinnamic acid hydroxylase [Chloroflexi bacterium]|nr:bifunctional 3-(3-hydroxy-phenyl)propionate/3-hydroxycinnamic acid hydroxylase [Chloroflexota bacterium]MBP8059721.1 bifunctional 3-(3-hydroxy-phenyl)propionate/3-hydroxycinnamic acid hydroxylase [Chloroflexota bacterium]